MSEEDTLKAKLLLLKASLLEEITKDKKIVDLIDQILDLL